MKNLLSHYSKGFQVFLGILKGKALTGPIHLELRITSSCNLNCIACFDHSPLKTDNTGFKPHNFMPLETIKEVLDSAKKIGVQEIILCSDGEPFLHKDIMKIIFEIKKRGFECTIFTNGIKLNKKIMDRLVELRVDKLRVSVWAGGTKTYQKTHPGAKKDTFNKLRDNLLYLSSLNRKSRIPAVVLCNVLFNMNYLTVPKMVRFAENVGADEIFFSNLSIRKHSEKLALSNTQKNNLDRLINNISKKIKIKNNLLSLISNQKMDIPCYQGFIYSVITLDGDVIPCCGSPITRKIGNINDESFDSIWHSEKYGEFRRKGKNIADKYFKGFRCSTLCPALSYNQDLHKKLFLGFKR